MPRGRIDLTEGKLDKCWEAPEPSKDALEVFFPDPRSRQDLFLQLPLTSKLR